MGKEAMKKATLKDLVSKKIKKEEDKYKVREIYVTSMGAYLMFKKPSEDLIIDIIDEIGDGKNTKSVYEAFKKLIYMCCDMLQDPELHKELDIVDPYDTVNSIFEFGDVMELGEKLVEFLDFGGKVDEIKN